MVLLALFAIVIFVLATQVAAVLVTKRPQPILDWFATVTTVLVILMFLWPPQFHYHFAAFLAPFLALTIALPISRLLADMPPSTASAAVKRQLNWVAVGLASVALVALAGLQVRLEGAIAHVIGPIPATVDQMVDSVGTNLALSNGLKPFTGAEYVPAVAAAWNQAFSHAQYVILTDSNKRRIAWTPALEAYLNDHFTQVYQSPRKLLLYVRKGLRVP